MNAGRVSLRQDANGGVEVILRNGGVELLVQKLRDRVFAPRELREVVDTLPVEDVDYILEALLSDEEGA